MVTNKNNLLPSLINSEQVANLKIPMGSWDQFIEDYNGFGCKNMCHNRTPNSETINLFQNQDAAKIYCNWCKKR